MSIARVIWVSHVVDLEFDCGSSVINSFLSSKQRAINVAIIITI